jgi:UDP-N-acetylglucosamine--N-acetylmuramyl-(pentapeptide) pyrophosphoryl-undecaprenol N-acetylglucosamine transferase
VKKILIAAGGTGGHIIPALAVARYLQARGVEVHWLGTRQGLEQQLIPPTGITLHYVAMRGVRKKNGLNTLAAPWRMLRAIVQSIQVIKATGISVVVGFGGFVSAPAGVAAWLLRKPLIIQEQNAAAGLANRLLAHFAKKIFAGFPNTFVGRSNVVVSGNPVREEISSLPAPASRFAGRNGPLKVLILGGSQGATFFNQLLPPMIAQLPAELRPTIVHSAGQGFAVETSALYKTLGVSAQVVAFIEDMAASYAETDLVICRAGALTVAELAAAGIGSILVPYPYAVDDHQTKNAEWLVKADAAVCVPQSSLNLEKLRTLLLTLNDKQRLLAMAMAARSLAQANATALVGEECLREIGSKKERRRALRKK